MGHTLSVRLDKELATWLEDTAARTGLSQGQIVREQLERARSEDNPKPFMRLAGRIKNKPPDLSMRKGYSRS